MAGIRTSVLSALGIKRRLLGGVEGISRGVVFGWAVSRSTPDQPPRLRFMLDGVAVGEAQCSIVRGDIAASAPALHRCGFRFDLKPHLRDLAGQELTIVDQASSASLPSTPLRLEPHAGWGAVDGIAGLRVHGWAVWADLAAEAAPVEVLIDGQVAGCVFTGELRPDLRDAGVPQLKSGFNFSIPTRWHDGRSHAVSARVQGSGRELRGGGIEFKCRIENYFDFVSATRVGGWIMNVEAPEHPVIFDLWVNGRCVKRNIVPVGARRDVETTHFDGKAVGYPIGFDVALPPDVRWSGVRDTVEQCLPGTREHLPGGNLVAVRRADVIERLERLVAGLAVDSVGETAGELPAALDLALRRRVIPGIISDLRSGSFDQPFIFKAAPRRSAADDSERIDVIVPVYKGYQETLDCIHSVLAARDECAMELVVINDCSPDDRLTNELRGLAAAHDFTLLENERNLGFVATVNRGMRLHGARDVVLLNSDTVVPHNWLAALRRAAYAASNIATVTPFSNRATIFSLPRACVDNDLPPGMSVEQMSALCAERNPGVIVDMPTAVGFCMYIRRLALDELGLFDEERWGQGYGEENDFCMSAAAQGWRNVAACDVFVQHHGSVSFAVEKNARVRKNLATLNALYPDYALRIQRHLAADPIAVPRARVNIALLKRLGAGYVLFVTHGLGGGTDTAIRELIRIHARDGRKALILRTAPQGKLLLAPAGAPHEDTLVIEYPRQTAAEVLAEHLRELGVESVHFHHTLGFRLDIWRLPELLGVPYDVAIHDYYLACPRVNLIDESGVYCGQPAIAGCERCVQGAPLERNAEEQLREAGGTVARWRDLHAVRLRAARRVVAPSASARAHLLKSLPLDAVEVVAHPEPAFSFERRRWNGELPHRVALIGAIGPPKGAALLLACARYALRQGLPLEFVVIGYTSCDEDFAALDNVKITGAYQPAELASIVEESRCTTALFLSLTPETYSYTLSEAWRLGLYPLALDIGAPADRIRETGCGAVLPFTQNPREIVAALLQVLEQQEAPPAIIQRQQSEANDPGRR